MTESMDTTTLFARQSGAYASARPGYPEGLYATLARLAPSRKLVWDCGCGSGQASVALAGYFERVVATDVSAEQIARAVPRDGVCYEVAPAEHVPGLEPCSVDLVVAATAAHWFELPAFYREVARVLRPGGVLAIWGYTSHEISAEIDDWTRHFARDVIGEYWRTDRLRLLQDGYRGLEVPAGMEDVTQAVEAAGPWRATRSMVLVEYAGYLRSWSASQAYCDARGEDPVGAHMAGLEAVWGRQDRTREVSWPLHMRVFRAHEEV